METCCTRIRKPKKKKKIFSPQIYHLSIIIQVFTIEISCEKIIDRLDAKISTKTTTDQVMNFRRLAFLAFFHDIFDSRPTSSGRRLKGEGGGSEEELEEEEGANCYKARTEGLEPHIKYNFTTGGNGRVEIRNNNEARRAQSSVIARSAHSFSPARLLFKNWWNSFPALSHSPPSPSASPAGPVPPPGFYSPEWPVYTELRPFPSPTVFCSFRKLYTRSLPAGKQTDACRPPPLPSRELRSRFNAT